MPDYFDFIAPEGITINSLRKEYKDHFYNQDWYLNEEFANRPLDSRLYRIATTVLEDCRGQEPPDATFKMPSAGVATYAFIAYWLKTGRRLWGYDYTWTSDRDGYGDPVYVGGYYINRPGFEIHRHLSLRRCHSVAPLG